MPEQARQPSLNSFKKAPPSSLTFALASPRDSQNRCRSSHPPTAPPSACGVGISLPFTPPSFGGLPRRPSSANALNFLTVTFSTSIGRLAITNGSPSSGTGSKANPPQNTFAGCHSPSENITGTPSPGIAGVAPANPTASSVPTTPVSARILVMSWITPSQKVTKRSLLSASALAETSS